jgi:hypothetical protein
VISVLLPTRGRPGRLEASIDSLFSTADDPGEVEVLCAVDPDDRDSADKCRRLSKMYGRERFSAWDAPERFGYGRLHEYVNFLAGQATGDWLMLWNDDAVMRQGRQGWDTVVHGYAPDRCLFMDAIYPAVGGPGARGNIFPVWPQSWYQNTGYVSLSPNNDVWISEVARRAGAEVRIPVTAEHQRAGHAAGDGDATHLEGRAAMGEGNDPEYDSMANRMARAHMVRVIMRLKAASAGD